MRTVVLRKLPEEDYRWLREQAASNGRSMEAELRALVAKHKNLTPKSAQPVVRKAKKGKTTRSLLTEKERKSLKPDARAALQRLREMFADAKGASGSAVDEFLRDRRKMWGEE